MCILTHTYNYLHEISFSVFNTYSTVTARNPAMFVPALHTLAGSTCYGELAVSIPSNLSALDTSS